MPTLKGKEEAEDESSFMLSEFSLAPLRPSCSSRTIAHRLTAQRRNVKFVHKELCFLAAGCALHVPHRATCCSAFLEFFGIDEEARVATGGAGVGTLQMYQRVAREISSEIVAYQCWPVIGACHVNRDHRASTFGAGF